VISIKQYPIFDGKPFDSIFPRRLIPVKLFFGFITRKYIDPVKQTAAGEKIIDIEKIIVKRFFSSCGVATE